MSFKQAERLETDGPIGIERDGDDHLIIYTETPPGGPVQRFCMRVSLFNAARIFGMLAFFLGISLPKALAKAIKL